MTVLDNFPDSGGSFKEEEKHGYLWGPEMSTTDILEVRNMWAAM
jgi:hypothetical protein